MHTARCSQNKQTKRPTPTYGIGLCAGTSGMWQAEHTPEHMHVSPCVICVFSQGMQMRHACTEARRL